MCRFLVYSGQMIDLKTLLILPQNSLFKQSFKKPYTPHNLVVNPRDHEFNIDGFGLCWISDIQNKKKIYLYKNIIPPWHDYNILNISECINSSLIFSHIRAIKPFSKKSTVNEQNCHPFTFENLLWMHNGDIQYVCNLKKYVYNNLSDSLINHIKGNTDSEYIFYIFIDMIKKSKYAKKYLSIKQLKSLFLRLIKLIIELNNNEIASLNIAFSDGKTIISTRFINSDNEDPPSLYYSQGDYLIKKKKSILMNNLNSNDSIIISSEPINNDLRQWKIIPKNNLIIVSKNKNIRIEKIII